MGVKKIAPRSSTSDHISMGTMTHGSAYILEAVKQRGAALAPFETPPAML